MTCALGPSRFHDELEIWRYSIGLLRTTHLMQMDGINKDNLLSTSHFFPKVLTADVRVEAIMTSATLGYFSSIHRTASGATRLSIVDDSTLTVTGEYLVIVMFDSADGYKEGGHSYELPSAADYDAVPISDVIRIERFAADTTPLDSGSFTVDLHIPGFDTATLSGLDAKELDVFQFPVVVGKPAESILGKSGVSLGLSPDGTKIRLTVANVEGDLLIVQDKNECDSSPCDSVVGICQNTKPSYTCSCPDTHYCSGTGCDVCKLKSEGLNNYYIKLTHTSRLDYGWRVKDVKFYSSSDCSTGLISAGISAATSLTDHGLGGTDKYYPGVYGPAKVDDDNADTAWWSACITCNPDELFDETHGAPAALEWEVTSTVSVGCIQVDQGDINSQYGGHATRGMKVERGPVSLTSPACGGPGESPCQPTMTVTASCGDTDNCGSTKINLGCGMPKTLLWGDILEPAGTEAFGFFGSYGEAGGVQGTLDVPSACHCHELCITHTGSGCRSYKFFDDGSVSHCVLQTSEFFTYTAGVAGAGKAPAGSAPVLSINSYTSGTPMDRFATSGATRELLAAKPWVESFTFVDGVISIQGYGFPTKNTETKADRGRYQRVKIVTRGEPCSSKVPSAVSGIGCVSTQLNSYAEPHQSTGSVSAPVFTTADRSYGKNVRTVYTVCSTRPSSWTSEEVMWDGITITAGSMDKTYDVCYCDGKECSRPESWLRVPPLSTTDGAIAAGDYTYVASAESVERGSSVDVTVTGPALGLYAATAWQVKAVPTHFDCTVTSTVSDATPTTSISSEATFTLAFANDVSAVGEYTVCLALETGGAFSPLAGTVTVSALSTDRIHAPIGAVYREQRWSALTGGAMRQLKLKGTKLPSVSDSKVVLSSGANCAWANYSFGGSVTRQPTVDTTPPTVEWGSTVPANAEVVGTTTTLKVVFNEPLSEPQNCLGGYTLKQVTGTSGTYTIVYSATTYFIACDSVNKTIIDNYVLLDFDPPAAGTYALFFDSYTIADLDGNSMFLSGSLDESTGVASWVFEIGTDATVPVLLTSEPKYGLLTGTGLISLTFSEPVEIVSTGYADLIDCGDDFVCDPTVDKMIAKYDFSDPLLTISKKSSTITIDVTSTVDVYDFKRYRITFAAGSFEDVAANLAGETVVEFLKDSTASFSSANVLGASSSTVDELVYDLELTAPAGTYSLCYCDAQLDNTLFDAGDGKTTMKPSFGKKGAASTTFTDLTVGSRLLSEHICSTKCAAGCVGDDCYCSGYDLTEGDMSEVYCLSPSLCRSVCDDLGTACAGFGTKGTDSCVLYASGFVLSASGAWTSYTKEMGTACTDPDEFGTMVGKATVTSRADVYVEYVVEPNVATSLEIAGTNLITTKAGMPLSLDRIMVVDCDGMCGYSSASTSVTHLSSSWNELAPYQWGVDKPHEDEQNDAPSTWSPASWEAHTGRSGNYETTSSAFCDGNLEISSLDPMPMEGHERAPTVHLCYNKCIEQDCEGDDCFCTGAYTGYDTASSNALCADEALCKRICDTYEGCKSIDMAKDMPRCFLNADFCDASDTQTPDANYDLLIKVDDQSSPPRKLESEKMAASADERALLPAMASGYSHAKLLIFPNITFASGGTFKVCFCDSSLLGDQGCMKPEDYGVEVGEVQASGISCLLTNSMFNRKTCVSMGEAGALRCYSGTPPDTEPPLYDDVQPSTGTVGGGGSGDAISSTYCRLHPELCGR
jgi:hypothetical protein